MTRHHEFYTDERARDAYRRWAAYLIDRVNTIDGVVYRDDPAIFAWELANEPRCVIGSEFDSRDGWTTDTIVDWAEEMSAFIKERDPNHMVAVGDEGFLNDRGTTWLYQAEAGVDHEALCAIDTIDFCTFHLYPDDWGTGYKFGYQWIERHLEVARKLGKPTVLEEYGTHVKRSETDLSKFEWGWERRATAYNNWLSILRSRGGNGVMFWILVGVDDQLGMYPDYDHYSVYRDLPTATLLQPHTDGFDTAPACRLGASLIDGTEPSPFVRAIHLHEHPQAGVPTTEMP